MLTRESREIGPVLGAFTLGYSIAYQPLPAQVGLLLLGFLTLLLYWGSREP